MSRRFLLGLFGFVLLMSFFTVQCSSYILCARYYNAIDSKRGTCQNPIENPSEKVKVCEQNLDQCTDDDRKIVNDVVSCLEKMKDCQGGFAAIQWGSEYLSCTASVLKLSDQCKKAFLKN